ncbi:unnamed protein product, partial [Acidithrix sp. C25]
VDFKTTFLNNRHRELGAKMVPFGGWEMPLSYKTGTVAEHLACRRGAVVFDVSHLGTVRLAGKDSLEILQRSFTNDLAKINPGRAQYTHHLDVEGSVVDDIIVWWVSEHRFDVMPNASNTSSVINSIGGQDVTADRSVLAVQGPKARIFLGRFFPEGARVPRFRVEELSYKGYDVLVAGTGYTGEDGIELAVPNEIALEIFDELLEVGVVPAGLGARDTLRLEAGLPLHGHELGRGITPFQANLGWAVSLTKGDFIGRDALVAESQRGIHRKLVGVKGKSRQPMRDGMDLIFKGEVVGKSTSGNYSPILEVGIAMCFAPVNQSLGDAVELHSGDRVIQGEICPLPFVAKVK